MLLGVEDLSRRLNLSQGVLIWTLNDDLTSRNLLWE